MYTGVLPVKSHPAFFFVIGALEPSDLGTPPQRGCLLHCFVAAMRSRADHVLCDAWCSVSVNLTIHSQGKGICSLTGTGVSLAGHSAAF